MSLSKKWFKSDAPLLNKKGLVVSKHEGILKWGETKVVKNIINLLN